MTTYQITVMGRFRLNDEVIACPRCEADRGLVFSSQGENVRGACPSGHVWGERRVSAESVRQAALATRPDR